MIITTIHFIAKRVSCMKQETYLMILICCTGYYFNETSINDENVVLTYHRVIEAFKFAYAKRSDLGDEDYWDCEEVGSMSAKQTDALVLSLHYGLMQLMV